MNAFNNAAVSDKETGLVWEQSPSTGTFTQGQANVHCNQLIVGNRFGWRLPTVQELASLLDPTQPNGLPSSNPFTIPNDYYLWVTATNPLADGGAPWTIGFANNGEVTQGYGGLMAAHAWCVRGGQGVDIQSFD